MRSACAVAICFLIYFSPSTAFGCIYTVRDVGFADVGSVPYRLYYYIRDDTPEELTTTFRQISYAVLMDSNVEVEIINVDQKESVPGRDSMHNQKIMHLGLQGIQSFPAAILISSMGQSLVLPTSVPGKTFKESMWSIIEDVVTSPKREEILPSIIQSYCVVLLIQGQDSTENERVKKAVDDAIGQLSMIMSQMPRSIEGPPRLIIITPELFLQERILLWSLGVQAFKKLDQNFAQTFSKGLSPNAREENTTAGPYVAVLYGRARRIGPLLEGEEITTNRIFNILSVIGQSCECGLDKRWLLGTMIPLRWGEKIQSEVAKHLGFDPESPMVKMEMSQILSMASSPMIVGQKSDTSSREQYGEEAVQLESGLARTDVSPAQFRQLVSPGAHMDTHVPGILSAYRTTLFIAGSMLLLILGGGVFIIVRARRRAL